MKSSIVPPAFVLLLTAALACAQNNNSFSKRDDPKWSKTSPNTPRELVDLKGTVVYLKDLDNREFHHHDPSSIIRYNNQFYIWYTEHTLSTNGWDGTHNDDANIIFFKNKWFLYYKGKPPVGGTRNGVATSDNLLGPYVKYAGNPVFAGHAETAWVHRDGVAAFGYKTYWSEDGFHFVTASDWSPGTVGIYCPENFGNGRNSHGVSWGLVVMHRPSPRHIGRLEIPLLIEDCP